MESKIPVYIGTAGWNFRKEHTDMFASEGSLLQRYAQQFNSVEINSSFYRDHLEKTYIRWRETVPENFKFSIKLSRVYTHDNRLERVDEHLKKVLHDISALEEKLGLLLIQLPPSLRFDELTARHFLSHVRKWFSKPIVIEPRHKSWATDRALTMLAELDIPEVIADPNLCPHPDEMEQRIIYYRLHGAPKIYESAYTNTHLELHLENLAKVQTDKTDQIWVVFDNTAMGHATTNAMYLKNLISSENKFSLLLPQ